MDSTEKVTFIDKNTDERYETYITMTTSEWEDFDNIEEEDAESCLEEDLEDYEIDGIIYLITLESRRLYYKTFTGGYGEEVNDIKVLERQLEIMEKEMEDTRLKIQALKAQSKQNTSGS